MTGLSVDIQVHVGALQSGLGFCVEAPTLQWSCRCRSWRHMPARYVSLVIRRWRSAMPDRVGNLSLPYVKFAFEYWDTTLFHSHFSFSARTWSFEKKGENPSGRYSDQIAPRHSQNIPLSPIDRVRGGPGASREVRPVARLLTYAIV